MIFAAPTTVILSGGAPSLGGGVEGSAVPPGNSVQRFQFDIVNGRGLAGHTVVIHGVDTIGGQVHLVDGRAVFLLDRLYRDARRGQIFGELAVVGRNVDELTQPCG